MELFPSQPDLSLQLSPPIADRDGVGISDLGFWKRALDSRNPCSSYNTPSSSHLHHGIIFNNSNPSTTASTLAPDSHHRHPYDSHPLPSSGSCSNPLQPHPPYPHRHHGQGGGVARPELLRPIRGIPVNQNPNHPRHTHAATSAALHHLQSFPFSPFDSSSPAVAAAFRTNNPYYGTHHHHGGGGGMMMRSNRLLPSTSFARFPAKRSVRAPRMRWTSTLHARFVRAVELLGGHGRATPKSVLELMDVKDLTLAHVKSHLQMYRTVKTTDTAAASSGQSDAFENGSSADTSSEDIFGILNRGSSELPINSPPQQPRPHIQQHDRDYNYQHALWSNSSSREAWLHGKIRDSGATLQSFEKELDARCLSYERLSEVNSSNHYSAETSVPKPNLEFTLGGNVHV